MTRAYRERLTELIYFKGIRAELRNANIAIEFGQTHGEPLGLVESAIRHRDRTKAVGEPFDDVWCVIDVEAPRPHPGLRQAIALAERKGVRLAVSNPCFKLWLLLHFGLEAAYLTSKAACKKLAAHDCGYSPNGKAFNYESLIPHQGTAQGRARQIAEDSAGKPDIVGRNPWTSVHVLVDEIRSASEL